MPRLPSNRRAGAPLGQTPRKRRGGERSRAAALQPRAGERFEILPADQLCSNNSLLDPTDSKKATGR